MGKVFVLGKERSSKCTSDHEFDLVETLSDHKDAIQSADCSANGELLATSDSSGTILVRKPDDAFEIVHRIPGDAFPATCIRFTPNNLLLGGYLTGAIRIYRKDDFRLCAEIAGHSRAVTALDVNDKYVVSVGEDTFMNVWELTASKTAPRVQLVSSQCAANDLLTGVAFGKGKTVLTAAYDTTHLKLWVPQ
jgi:WD40 repeat protein